MSGHSKWSKIKRQKDASDQKRGNLFTKVSKLVTIAARDGGGDPTMNFKLRLAIDQARAVSMPKDNIEKAIKRGTGELEGGQIEEVVYEGFGPNGIAIVIEALTDNKNRTVANIKHVLSKYGGSLGSSNSVLWQFEQKGVIRISNDQGPISNFDEFQLKLIDMGADDIEQENSEIIIIYTEPENLQKLKEKLEKQEIKIENAELEFMPKEKTTVDENLKTKLEKIFEDLEDDDDVNNIYTNADF